MIVRGDSPAIDCAWLAEFVEWRAKQLYIDVDESTSVPVEEAPK